MDEEIKSQTDTEQQTTVGIDDKSSDERIDWVEEAIRREATPKSLREPKTDQEFIKKFGVAESTYYYTIAKKENQEKILDLCFKQAKRRTANILEKMGEKAEDGNDTSIAQFMEYVLEVKKKLELSGDKDNPINIIIDKGIANKNGISTSDTISDSK